jgi:hypothetical protein
MPRASTMLAIVEAVPIVMQCPALRDMHDSKSPPGEEESRSAAHMVLCVSCVLCVCFMCVVCRVSCVCLGEGAYRHP